MNELKLVPDSPEDFVQPTKPFENASMAEQIVYETSFALGKKLVENAELAYKATHDELTGLLNLAGLNKELSERPDTPVIIVFADSTNLKAINDKFGHKEGDEVIRATAKVLADSTREGDIIARIGGDEFVIIPVPRESEVATDIAKMKSRIAGETEHFLTQNTDYAKYGLDLAVGAAAWQPGQSIMDMRDEAEKDMKKHKAEQHAANGQYRDTV